MATALPEGIEVAECPHGETNECDPEGSLKPHRNLLALFSAKASSHGDVEDIIIWRLKERGGEGSPKGEQVFMAYKRSGTKEDNDGWTIVIPPSRYGETLIQRIDCTRNASEVSEDLLMFFDMYTMLKEDTKSPVNFREVKNVVFYVNNPLHLMFPVCILKESKEKDFILSTAMWKFRDDLEINEGLVRRLKMKTPVGGTDADGYEYALKKNIVNLIGSDFRDFSARVSFSFVSETGLFEKMLLESDGVTTRTFKLSYPVSDFVGRRKELREMLHLLIRTSKRWLIGPSKKLVLSGLGGVGKSELAREYCMRHLVSLYGIIAWIDAESNETLTASFKGLAHEYFGIDKETVSGGTKDIVEIMRETFQVLSRHRTLLVYDNAESYHQVLRHLPSKAVRGRMHIILTSRTRDWSGLPLIPLGPFTEREALELVKGSLRHLTTWSDENGLELCNGLGQFPLAIKQAVSFIREKDTLLKKDGRWYPIPEYLKLLESNTELILDHPLSEINEGDYAGTTFRAIRSTLQHLKNTIEGVISIILLNVLSYLSSDDIDVDAVLVASAKYNKVTLEMAFKQLSEVCLVTIQSKRAKVHRLVKAVNRNRVRKLGMEVHVLREVMSFAMRMDVQNMLFVWGYVRRHESLMKDYPQFPLEILRKLLEAELYDVVLSYSRSAHESLVSVLGPQHPDVLIAMYVWSIAHNMYGELARDEEKLREYLGAWRNVSAPKPLVYFKFLLTYGLNLTALGKWEESINAFDEVLSEGSSALGADSHVILMARIQKMRAGGLMSDEPVDVDDWKEIEELMGGRSFNGNRAVDSATAKGGAEDTAAFGNTGDLDAMSDRINVIGGKGIHGEILARTHYSVALYDNKRIEESLAEIRKAEKLAQDVLCDNEVKMLRIRYHLAKCLLKMGRVDCAERELDDISSKMNPSPKYNMLSLDVDCLRVQILCARDNYYEAVLVMQSWYLNEGHNPINIDGLNKACEIAMQLLDAGKFTVVSRMLGEMISTLNACSERERIPIFFIRYLYRVSVKLLEKGLKVDALRILKTVYREFEIAMGEEHMEALVVKLTFAVNYCSLGVRGSMDVGLNFLSQIQATVSKMDAERVPELREFKEKVKESLEKYVSE